MKGFELVELLIVVAIIGILAAVVIPNAVGLLDRGEKEKQEATPFTSPVIGNCTAKGEIWLRNSNDYNMFIEAITIYSSGEQAKWKNGYQAYPALASFTLPVPYNSPFPYPEGLPITASPWLAFRSYSDKKCPDVIATEAELLGQRWKFRQQIRIIKAAFPEWQDAWQGQALAGEYFVGAATLSTPEEYYRLRANISSISPCWNMGEGKIVDITGYIDASGNRHYLVDEDRFPIDYPFGFPVTKNFTNSNFGNLTVSGCSVPIVEDRS